MKNVSFEQKKMKLWHERYSVASETEIMYLVLKKHYISLFPK